MTRTYTIVVRGRLSPRFAAVFAAMAAQPVPGGHSLVGPVRDQAELRGMVELLSGLGVEIVSIGSGA